MKFATLLTLSSVYNEQNSIFEHHMGPKEMMYNLYYGELGGDVWISALSIHY